MRWTQLSHSSNRRSVSWARDWLEKQCVLNENEGQLPFLNVLLSRGSDGSVSMSVYRKLSHTDKYLDFDSHHPLSHKRSVANTLHGRARTHCSSSQSRAHEMDCVKSALLQNGYPASILHSHKTRVPQIRRETRMESYNCNAIRTWCIRVTTPHPHASRDSNMLQAA